MSKNQAPTLLATGNILPSTFVKIDTSNDNCGLQASTNDKIIGISQEGSDGTPGVLTSTYAAVSGETFMLYGLGDICLLKATSGWTRGDLIESDSSGQGITALTTGGLRNIGAVALTNTNANEFGRVQILIFEHQPSAGTSVAGLTITDGGNITVGTSTGTQVATNASQKLGFWGATAVVQPSSSGELIGLNGNAATAANATNMNSNGNLGSTNYDLNDLVKALKTVGILHT